MSSRPIFLPPMQYNLSCLTSRGLNGNQVRILPASPQVSITLQQRPSAKMPLAAPLPSTPQTRSSGQPPSTTSGTSATSPRLYLVVGLQGIWQINVPIMRIRMWATQPMSRARVIITGVRQCQIMIVRRPGAHKLIQKKSIARISVRRSRVSCRGHSILTKMSLTTSLTLRMDKLQTLYQLRLAMMR